MMNDGDEVDEDVDDGDDDEEDDEEEEGEVNGSDGGGCDDNGDDGRVFQIFPLLHKISQSWAWAKSLNLTQTSRPQIRRTFSHDRFGEISCALKLMKTRGYTRT